MKRSTIEVSVGAFVIVGFLCFAFIAVKLGEAQVFQSDRYRISARFDSVSGLREGAHVEVAGVRVGNVEAVRVDPKRFEAIIEMSLEQSVVIPKDSIASIRTAGIIGDKFIKITPGAATEKLKTGDEIRDTESAISFEELISKYIFEKK